jgi:hypothetical protein
MASRIGRAKTLPLCVRLIGATLSSTRNAFNGNPRSPRPRARQLAGRRPRDQRSAHDPHGLGRRRARRRTAASAPSRACGTAPALARIKGAEVKTHASPGDPIVPALVGELRNLLITGSLFESISLHITQRDGWVQLHIMAVSIGSLGVLLATISDQAKLGDLNSLSGRITPADCRFAPDQRQYELIGSRYPTDKFIVFAAKIRFPVSDLSEVIRRLRQR